MAAAGWSAIPATAAGAASSPATAAVAPGRRREPSLTAKRKRPLAGRFLHGSFTSGGARESARRQHHHHLAAFEPGVLFDLGELGDVSLYLVEQLGADLLVGHLAATVAQGDLDLVAFLEEALHRAHLHVIVVIVDHRPQLDLLDLDDLLFLAGFRGFLLRRILELPVVHDLANGRIVVRRNLHQIHARIHGHLDGRYGFDGAMVETILVDQLDLRVADVVIDARPVFGDCGRGSIGTANG